MRVAVLTPELDGAYGWTRYALDLSHVLVDQGIEIIALTQPQPSLAEDISWIADVRPVLPHLVPPTGSFLLRSLASALRVRRAVSDCDLLHVIAEPYTPLAMFAAGSRPVVVTAHGTYVPKTSQRRFVGMLYRWAYRRAHLIAVSNYTAEQVQAALPGIPVTVIRNGVHFARFQQPALVPAKAGPTILASGAVKPRKGLHVLIDAMAQVRDSIPNVQLIITGRQDDPGYLAQLQDQIAALQLVQNVHLLGQIPEHELLGWYQHADVFALPTLNIGEKFEGFGLVFLEASACGLPVIGTMGSGVQEAIIDGTTGLLVPQNDVPALADAITCLLRDKTRREQMGVAGRDYARSQDWSAVAVRVFSLYQQLCT